MAQLQGTLDEEIVVVVDSAGRARLTRVRFAQARSRLDDDRPSLGAGSPNCLPTPSKWDERWLAAAFLALVAFPAWPVSLWLALVCVTLARMSKSDSLPASDPPRRRFQRNLLKAVRQWTTSVVIGLAFLSLGQASLRTLGGFRRETVQIFELKLRTHIGKAVDVLGISPTVLAAFLLLTCLSGWIALRVLLQAKLAALPSD